MESLDYKNDRKIYAIQKYTSGPTVQCSEKHSCAVHSKYSERQIWRCKNRGRETSTTKSRDARRITAAEMKYVRTAGYTGTDCKTNTQIAKELKITQILDELLEYKRNWI